MNKKVLVFGSFDPFSTAELDRCKTLLKEKGYSQLWVCLKGSESFRQRYAIARMICDPYRKIKVLKRPFESFTVRDRLDVVELEMKKELCQIWSQMPAKVRSYIMANYLYQQELSRKDLSKKRFEHVLRVAELSRDIAIANRLDGNKAYAIGLFHDAAKEMDPNLLERYMDIYHPDKKGINVHLWHQYVGAICLSRYFKVRDREFLKAVRHHATGDDSAALSMVIYCSDKLDPGRGYDSSGTVELCRQDICSGFKETKRQQDEYLRKEGIIL